MQDWKESKAIMDGIDNLLKDVEMVEIKKGLAHSLKTSGKRLRPLTLLLTAELNNGTVEHALDAALALECIHTASLIQDDILDEGLKRRGEPTSHEKFGLFLAMVCNDYLISKSMMLISKYDQPSITAFGLSGLLAAEGELLDIKSRTFKATEDDYFECVLKKTAAMFIAAFEIGARSAGTSEEKALLCREMGKEFGIAYQIVDDLIEFLSIDDDTKKSAQQSYILPLVYMEKMSSDEAVDRCMKHVETSIARIDEMLKNFDDGEAKKKLIDVIDILRNYNGVKIK
ncbi:polyprenyl synthetase family protein [Methanocella sp. CWC-04]|uniref:Polyprenyl synthetase family protein n=1 Tax=Methanooceanicella nereidis TaxID=2052831 RepID=A0AAP2RCF8_9EURY|nr:polyprenyl synthetase family protein [Methanocella sp. CWC-04]MCD1294729.1 polyprenyl synthetase family protein [Methanocella sp. CWC-04]